MAHIVAAEFKEFAEAEAAVTALREQGFAPSPGDRERATSIFWRHRAHSIELAEGEWKDGTWQDFDPVSTPRWRKAPGR